LPNAPLKRGIEPLAQGNTLGNSGQQNRRRPDRAKALSLGECLCPVRAESHTAYKTQGVALGYLVVGLSDRHSAVVYSLIGCYEENDCLSVFHPVQYNTNPTLTAFHPLQHDTKSVTLSGFR